VPTVKDFEDLRIWQNARVIATRVHELTPRGAFRNEFILTRQMRKSAVSIISNIAEGFERGRPREFQQFLRIARGSCGELRAQIAISADREYVSRSQHHKLAKQLIELTRQISSLMQYLQTQLK